MKSISDKATDALLPHFERNFYERGELGASVCVFCGEDEVVNLAFGHRTRDRKSDWDGDTLVPVWSATKGPSSLACLLALEEANLPVESPVCEIWPRFAEGGKEQVTFAQVLSHTSGLCALDDVVPILDYAAVIHALEDQTPLFVPGTRQAYQARTFGFLVDEIVQRITGADSLGEYFRERIGAPMNLNFWIGLPQTEWHRVATLYPGKMRTGNTDDEFLNSMNTRGSLTQRTFFSPAGLNSVQDMNQPETWSHGFPGMGGVGSACALAQFYAMLAAGGFWRGQRLVSERVAQIFQATLSQRHDDVLCADLAFSAGMMMDPIDLGTGQKKRRIFGSSHSAFGHPGAGGSLAFADPQRGFGFAYVMNQMEPSALPGPRALDLVQALDAVM